MLRKATVLALLAIAILIAAPIGNVAFAGLAWGTIRCCCGEHAGDHDCGCPDCPAGDQGGERTGDHDDGSPRLRPCGADPQWVSPAAFPPFVAPATTALIAPARRALDVPDTETAPPERALQPTTPPS